MGNFIFVSHSQNCIITRSSTPDFGSMINAFESFDFSCCNILGSTDIFKSPSPILIQGLPISNHAVFATTSAAFKFGIAVDQSFVTWLVQRQSDSGATP
jgi:hypothetical protein